MSFVCSMPHEFEAALVEPAAPSIPSSRNASETQCRSVSFVALSLVTEGKRCKGWSFPMADQYLKTAPIGQSLSRWYGRKWMPDALPPRGLHFLAAK